MLPPHILTIDDCVDQLDLLSALLEPTYRVSPAPTSVAALTTLVNDPPQAITLDLHLPDMAGDLLCRAIRAITSVPILVLSGYGDERRKVALLDAGADDFVVKPVGRDELLARIRALLRRATLPALPLSSAPVSWAGQLSIDLAQRRVLRGEVEVHLRPMEWGALRVLLQVPGGVITHAQLLAAVWGVEDDSRMASLHVLINQLRRKLEPEGRPTLITTVTGVGYRMAPPTAQMPFLHRPAVDGAAVATAPLHPAQEQHPREMLDRF